MSESKTPPKNQQCQYPRQNTTEGSPAPKISPSSLLILEREPALQRTTYKRFNNLLNFEGGCCPNSGSVSKSGGRFQGFKQCVTSSCPNLCSTASDDYLTWS
ncbi:hypothetical protein M758_8G091300 [Ceratodon purpureus]|nr:hypothetical protein M758_8G091300 [Ceratodon purpureus]